MSGLSSLFPLVAFIGIVVGIVFVWRMGKRFSLGSVEGGSWEFELPEPPGQRDVPWELDQVDRQLATIGEGSPLITLLNQMVEASPLDRNRYLLGPRATKAQIEAVVADLEKAIGMGTR